MSDDLVFELVDNIKPPGPFDRALAHLEMRTRTNNLTDGMDLSVSATFSEEYVEIPLSDGDFLEVKCAINEAIIVATYFNCSPTEHTDMEPKRGFVTKTEIAQSDRATTSRKLGFGVKGGTKGSVSIATGDINSNASSASGKQREQASAVVSRSKSQQVEYDVDQIRIFRNPDGTPLNGKMVDGQVCWRAIPWDKKRPFGVIAELQVKRGWMPISEPRQQSAGGKLVSAIAQVFSSTDEKEEFHRRAFSLLVEHLVQKGLQSTRSGLNAVLAARMVVAKPSAGEDLLEPEYTPVERRDVELPVEDLKTILTGDSVSVLNMLAKHQVDEGALASLIQSNSGSSVAVLRPAFTNADAKAVSIIADRMVIGVLNEFSVKVEKDLTISVDRLLKDKKFNESSKCGVYREFLSLVILSLDKYSTEQNFESLGNVTRKAVSIVNGVGPKGIKRSNNESKVSIRETDNSSLTVSHPREVTLSLVFCLFFLKYTFDKVTDVSISLKGDRPALSFNGSNAIKLGEDENKILNTGAILSRDLKKMVGEMTLGDILGMALRENVKENRSKKSPRYKVPLNFLSSDKASV